MISMNTLGRWCASLIAVSLSLERAVSFAKSKSAHHHAQGKKLKTSDSSIPQEHLSIGEEQVKKFQHIKTKQDACKELEHSVISYYDSTAWIQNCIRHPITGTDDINELVHMRHMQITEVPARIFLLFPEGLSYQSAISLQGSVVTKNHLTQPQCHELEGKYLTANGEDIYFIQSCQKHSLTDFYDFALHNTHKKTLESIDNKILSRIPTGRPIVIKKDQESPLVFQMNGDSQWSSLSRQRNTKALKDDSLAGMLDVQKTQKLQNTLASTCKQLDRKVVAFYSENFYIQNCKKRAIKDFSVEFQHTLQNRGGIGDLTSEQYQIISNGTPISEADVLKFMK